MDPFDGVSRVVAGVLVVLRLVAHQLVEVTHHDQDIRT